MHYRSKEALAILLDCNKLFEGFEQRNDMIRPIFSRITMVAIWSTNWVEGVELGRQEDYFNSSGGR